MPSETTTACVRLLVFFKIRRSTFPYGVEDDASTISQTPTTHYTSTCVKMTIVTHLSFGERIAIVIPPWEDQCEWHRMTRMAGGPDCAVMCVVCFLPIHSGHQWTYQPGSHRRKVTQDFSSILSAVHALIFLARRIQPFLSLVDREVEFCVLTILIVLHPLGIFFFFFSFLVRKIPFAGIELTS